MTIAKRFWSKVDKEGGPIHPELGRCWIWTAGRIRPGSHGTFYLGGHATAHRVAWMLERGPIPSGACVLHRCDNPPCVNPDHLFLGTQADNVADMDAKGRRASRRIMCVSMSKLTEADARAIRCSREPTRVLVKRYGISDSAVRQIRNGRSWKHLSPNDEANHGA